MDFSQRMEAVEKAILTEATAITKFQETTVNVLGLLSERMARLEAQQVADSLFLEDLLGLMAEYDPRFANLVSEEAQIRLRGIQEKGHESLCKRYKHYIKALRPLEETQPSPMALTVIEGGKGSDAEVANP